MEKISKDGIDGLIRIMEPAKQYFADLRQPSSSELKTTELDASAVESLKYAIALASDLSEAQYESLTARRGLKTTLDSAKLIISKRELYQKVPAGMVVEPEVSKDIQESCFRVIHTAQSMLESYK